MIQESTEEKAAWLENVQKRFPVGVRVRVVGSDLPEYIDVTGVVIDYDIGVYGEWPMISVKFDTLSNPEHDGFYDDELKVL
jgi:hypothetical protein